LGAWTETNGEPKHGEKLVAWPCAAPKNEEKISSKTEGENSKVSLTNARSADIRKALRWCHSRCYMVEDA
jgi:hypothetical protein